MDAEKHCNGVVAVRKVGLQVFLCQDGRHLEEISLSFQVSALEGGISKEAACHGPDPSRVNC